MEQFDNLQIKIKEFFSKYSGKQKVAMAVAAIGFVAVMVTLIMFLTKPEYITLYRDLDLETTAKVTKGLDDSKIPYKIQSDGTIVVPKQYVNKAKLDLVSAGLPNAKFDYKDLIERNSMFLSESEKNQARNYAHQNEIAKVLESIPGVEQAFVNLVIPENKDFILQENRQEAKASVMLKFRSGYQINQEDIDGIATLVSGSVEGLNSENVTIHGANGQVLNRNSTTDSDAYISSTNMELQKKVKDDIENSLNNFLAPIFGYGNTSVMASVKLNFDADTTQTKVFHPPVEGETEGLARSLQESIEKVENKAGAIGDPGVGANAGQDGNVVDYATLDDTGASTYDKHEKIINYELNEIVRNVEKAKGQIESLTVAVVINKDILTGGELTEDMKKDYTDYITAATGLDTKSVEVYAQPFNQDLAKALEAGAQGTTMPLWMWIALGLIVLIPIALLVGYILVSRRRKKKAEMEQMEDAKDSEELMQKRMEEEQSIEVEIKESGRKKSIENLIERNPEIVSQLLKSWIEED